MSHLATLTHRGLRGGRRTLGEIGRALTEPSWDADQNRIVLPAEMRQERVDLVLLFTTLALFGLGLVMVFSSTSFSAQYLHAGPFKRFFDQSIRGVVGLGFLFGLAFIDYRRLSPWAMWVAIGGAVLLGLLLIPGIGHSSKGATRWINLGPVNLQPTELARVGLVIYLARLLSKPPDRMQRFATGPLPALLITGAFIGLILAQKSLGSSLALGITAMTMCVMAGMRWKHFHLIVVPVVGVAVLAVVFGFVHPYQIGRIKAWIDYWLGIDDPSGPTYQLRQSILALGSGQIRGVGLGASQQKRLFLPDAHTDFIFSVIGEELGFLGCLVLLAAFTILIARGLRVAAEAEDRFGYLLAVGLTINLAVYIVINIAVTMALLPTTGLPLPFVSYGGSALIANLAGVGLLLSVSRRRGNFVLARGRRRRRGLW